MRSRLWFYLVAVGVMNTTDASNALAAIYWCSFGPIADYIAMVLFTHCA